ncbi:hypothetical protein DOTSEDRAFT_26701 [Dothistroma septosporum NZE10]|uniref:Uncharacterized protein n=1 Tax=Dothistroma septosporum (strain NZE10 / CBS 128990) TaxID=675120 RepID=N1PJP5_DOTSN|nr:hypothetical protein DOTSEDRAFT_26701 [Dothistroma septosporum NZE10]
MPVSTKGITEHEAQKYTSWHRTQEAGDARNSQKEKISDSMDSTYMKARVRPASERYHQATQLIATQGKSLSKAINSATPVSYISTTTTTTTTTPTSSTSNMQMKYIVATIASMAVTSAIAGPVAEPAANEVSQELSPHLLRRAEPAELGAQGVEANKRLQKLYSQKLLNAYKKNWAAYPEKKRPTVQEILALKDKSKQSPAKNLQIKDKRDPWSQSWGTSSYNGWDYRNGCQLYYPFSTHGWMFDWNLHNYYTCYGAYPNCEDVDDHDDDDCDDGYC